MLDIEDQTSIYALFSLLNPDVQADVNAIGFGALWGFEEWWHGEQLAVVRAHLDPGCLNRIERRQALQERQGAWRAQRKMLGAFTLPLVFGKQAAKAVVAVRGFQNEIQTMHGYGQLKHEADQPVLDKILLPIIRQEARHVRVYESVAHEVLDGSKALQSEVRAILRYRLTTVVGEEYQGQQRADSIVRTLFGGKRATPIVEHVDDRFSSLPGMKGLRPMRARVQAAMRRGM